MSEVIEEKLWKRVERYVPFLQLVPFVRMVAVCNNLSFGNVDDDSDIDLFIVAEKGRLFIVRTMITAIFQILGVRRHGKKVNGRFCLSFFIDEEMADLSAIALDNDFYLAYWIPHLLPVIDERNGAGLFYSEVFLSKNAWVHDYFDTKLLISRKHLIVKSGFFRFFQRILNFILIGLFGKLIEGVLKKWQLKRARKKASIADERSNLLVKENILKFHNVDRRREYNLKWAEKFGKDAKLVREKFLSL